MAGVVVVLFVGCGTPRDEVGGVMIGETGVGVTGVGRLVPGDASLDDVARFLAGMPARGGSTLDGMRASGWWQEHRRRMDALWDQYEARRGRAIAEWRGNVLGIVDGRHYVFYPFSGPDFVFANAFFPRASHYLLVGLEPVGGAPVLGELTEADLRIGVENLYDTIETNLQHSYFITKDMREDLVRSRLKGVVPVMLAFLARTGHTLDGVSPASAGGDGYHFRVRSGGGRQKHVYYFRQNLADGALSGRFLEFSESFGHPVTFIKSASYLMHGGGFSTIRNHILDVSAAIVQTPSGVPFRYFEDGRWDIRLYGSYVRTLDMFEEYYQPDLAAAFMSGRYPVAPIRFGMGYVFYEGESSFLVATRKAIAF
ncbi:MAG: hypothetical protein AAF591_14055 [Verrucomicrobiota bacterium]